MEKLQKACKQALGEIGVENTVESEIKYIVNRIASSMLREEIRNQVRMSFNSMKISVDITGKDGTSSISC